MDDFVKQALALSEKVIDFYLGDCPIEEILPFLDSRLSWHGIREGECGSSLKEAIQYYNNYKSDGDIGCWLEGAVYQVAAGASQFCAVNGAFDLCRQSRAGSSKTPVLATFVYHKGQDGKIKLASFHLSARIAGQKPRDGEPKEASPARGRFLEEGLEGGQTQLCGSHEAVRQIQNYILQRHGDAKAALIFVDVDNFGSLGGLGSDSLGGQILEEMGQKLKRLFRSTDIISRAHSNRFLIFMKDIQDKAIIFEKERQIAHSLNGTYSVGLGPKECDAVEITVTAGAAYMDSQARDYEELARQAREALEYAKSRGRGQYAIYGISGLGKEEVEANGLAGTYERINVIPACLNLLTQIKDSKAAIMKVLETIGELCRLKRAYLFEFSKDGRFASMNYEWCSSGMEGHKGICRRLDGQRFEKAWKSFGADDMLIWTRASGVPEEWRDCIPEDSGSGLQVLAYAQENPIGILGIEHGDAGYVFAREEMTLFQYIAKLLGVKIANFRYEEENSRLSGFDAVTGLISFLSFCSNGKELLSQNPGEEYAICTFELNNFNEVSEWYGYVAGNKVIKHFAELLKRTIPNIYFITRNGNSIFHVLAGTGSREQFIQALNKLYENRKLYLEQEVLPFAFTGGVYFFHGSDEADLSYGIDRSGIARKSVSEKRHAFAIYDSAMEKRALKEKKFASRMAQALKEKEFKIYLQPKYRISDEALIGAEALVRWISPKFGFLPPGQFIPLFEKNEFIVELDFYVLDEMCGYLQKRFDSRLEMYTISVNQSRVTISRSDYIRRLKGLLANYTFPREYMELEITESAFGGNMDGIIKVVEQVKALGCMISIDDFGSGYSSLNMVRKIPFDVLKIAREFLPEKDFSDNSLHVLESVVEMARKIDVQVICEGVETRSQIDFLEQIGCDQVQGFYFSKPMPVEIFDGYLNNAKRSREVLKRIFQASLEQAAKGLSAAYGTKFYMDCPRSCPSRARQLLKLAETDDGRDMIGVKAIFLNSAVKGSIFIMVKKLFAISILNQELHRGKEELLSSLFHLNEKAIVKLEQVGKEIAGAYASCLEESSGVRINSFSMEVFKESVEDMLQYAISEMNGLSEKVHCIENRFSIHKNNREEVVAQVFLFMDQEAEELLLDSILRKELLQGGGQDGARLGASPLAE